MAQTFLQYADVNLYYALFVAVLNIGILYFILRRNHITYSSKESQEDQKTPSLIFLDKIDDGSSWGNYGSGKVYKSDDISWRGKYRLKKDVNPDPFCEYP